MEQTKKYKNKEDYPLMLEPMHIKEIMDIGRKQAYNFVNEVEILNLKRKNPPFYVKRFGKLLKIPRDDFFLWLEGKSDAGA